MGSRFSTRGGEEKPGENAFSFLGNLKCLHFSVTPAPVPDHARCIQRWPRSSVRLCGTNDGDRSPTA